MKVQTPWDSLAYAACPSTFHFHAFGAWTLKAGSWLVRQNSSWRRGISFYSCNKHLIEILCKETSFRNMRRICILSVHKTQVRHQLVLVFGSLLGGGGGCAFLVYTVLYIFVYCWEPVTVMGLFCIQKSAWIWIEGSTHLLSLRS